MRELHSLACSRRRSTGILLAPSVLALLVLQASDACAEVTVDQRAQAAYERATAAKDRGDFATAAREFALADELVPSPNTLEAALEAAIEADAPTTAMELEARVRLRGETGQLGPVAAKARERFSGRVGRVKVVCPGTKACQATLDDEPFPTSTERFVLVGRHSLRVTWNERSETRLLDVRPGILSEQSGFGAVDPYRQSLGLSPAFFIVSLSATFLGISATSLSGSEAMSTHDRFVGARCDQPGAAPMCTMLAEDGRAAQLRTNLLLGATAALGVTTVVLGVVTFGKKDSKSGTPSALSIEARPGGAFARLAIGLP